MLFLLPLPSCFYYLKPCGRSHVRDELQIVLYQGLSKTLISFVERKEHILPPVSTNIFTFMQGKPREALDIGTSPFCFRL